MDYSSLAAPSPSISKSLFHCLSNIDEEDSSSESGSPSIPLNSDDMSEIKQVGGLRKHLKSPTNRLQRRTTDSFLPVCSLQALSRSSKKILPRMSFSSPNIMRGKSNKRPQTEKVKKSRSGGVSQSNLTNVKLEMLNVLLETKNEEVANLKSSLQQYEQKVAMLESKMITLEEELKQQQQQQQLEPPSILEMSLGSNSHNNTDHDSQTMPYVSEDMLEDLTNQLKGKNEEIDHLEDEIEQWQEQANEWKNKYQSLVEQMQNGTVSDEESTNTNDLINFCNECQEDNLELSDEEEDEESSGISYSVKDSPMAKVEEIDEDVATDTNNTSFSNDGPQSPLPRGSTDSDEINNENVRGGSVAANRYLRNRAPLGESSIQNVQKTPISNTKRQSRRRQKTKRYSPTAAKNNRVKEVNEDDTPEKNVEFGEVGYKFRKNFGWFGSYNGQVKEILADGTRLCIYPADPNGDEYLTLEELSKTKPLKKPRHGKEKEAYKKDEDVADQLELNERGDGTTDGVLQVKKNVTCHIW
eukprot:scaffold542_cov154-Skeletonema_menzelii.AAC.9